MTYRLYHEKQEAGLCGVHALNTLLQAPMFTEIELATIARSLDSKERQLMLESGHDSKDFLKYAAEDSGNVGDDGNYSVQVLSEALKVLNVEVQPLGKRDPPPGINAFICNLAEHWFTIRRLYGHWWDLNSLHSAPRWISDLALGVYLEALRSQGYSIFLIRGDLPEPNSAVAHSLGSGRGRWLNVKAGGAARDEDADMEAAIKASLRAAGVSTPSPNVPRAGGGGRGGGEAFEDEELAAAIAASLETPPKPAARPPEQQPSAGSKRANPIVIDDDDDAQLAAALELSRQVSDPDPKPPAAVVAPPPTPSLPPVPAEPAAGVGVITVGVMMGDGTRFRRRYLGTNTLAELHAAVAEKIGGKDFTLLFPGPPKKDLGELSQSMSLMAAGVADALLMLQMR